MGKELKVDRLWLSHSIPIFAFSLLTFFGHKRIHTLEFFCLGVEEMGVTFICSHHSHAALYILVLLARNQHA